MGPGAARGAHHLLEVAEPRRVPALAPRARTPPLGAAGARGPCGGRLPQDRLRVVASRRHRDGGVVPHQVRCLFYYLFMFFY